MPKRTHISSILVIGAGPIVIGQACEFDYSGTQAIKALREEGYRIVLGNPRVDQINPTISKILGVARRDGTAKGHGLSGNLTVMNTRMTTFAVQVCDDFTVFQRGSGIEGQGPRAFVLRDHATQPSGQHLSLSRPAGQANTELDFSDDDRR